MKTTEKIKFVLVFAIAIMFASNTNAQETANTTNYDQGFRLGIGLNAGYAAHDPFKLAVGADARLQYDLSKRYSVTLTTGVTNLFVSKADGTDLALIPAKAGFKAFVWNDQFYIMGEVGAAFALQSAIDPSTSLLLAPSIGYASKYIDVSLRYDHYNDFARVNNNGLPGKGVGTLGIRLAYGFEL